MKFILTVIVLLLSTQAQAAFRIYLLPFVTGSDGVLRPKYFSDGTITGDFKGAIPYAFEPWMFVGADLASEEHITLSGQADVFLIPANLTDTLTAGQVTNVQNKLESINVPAGWVSTALTWAQVLRTVFGILNFYQRYTSIYFSANGTLPPALGGTVTLNSTFASLPLAVRNALTATATDLGFSTTGIAGGTTLRTILKLMADQYAARAFILGEVEL
jgi:hypothetical protein